MKNKHLLFKGILVLFLLIAASSNTVNAQCIPDEITFSSQAEIDNFTTNYPDCTEILGDVDIHESSSGDIANLNGLSAITSIGGDLQIYYCNALTSLKGLDNLRTIGGSMDIEENPALISLNGLENLSTIDGSLYIIYNTSLASISSLGNLTFIGEKLDLVNNSVLPKLSGLDNLTSIGGDVRIINTAATNLSSLSSLLSIGGTLEISYNNSLISLSGLDNIDPSTINYLIISGCPLLTTCEVESICDYIGISTNLVAVSDNATGCNSVDQIETACQILSIEGIISDEEIIQLHPNPTKGILNINLNNTEVSEIKIWNTAGVLIRNEKLSENGQIDISYLPNGLYLIEFWNNKRILSKRIIKE